MNCPYCNYSDTRVSDSREGKDGSFVKRRRECQNCKKRFTTIERVLKLDLEVRKQSGDIEVFNLQKIKKGILKACEKRPVTLEEIDLMINNILGELKKVDEKIIDSSYIGKIVLKNLKNVDEMSYLRFAIVHNNYKNLDEFSKELNNLKKF